MLFDEEEMLRICEKYGIEIVEKEGAPLYMDKEMDDDFSFEQMMHEQCSVVEERNVLLSETVSLSIPVYYNMSKKYNDYYNKEAKSLDYENEKNNHNVKSTISCDNENKFAA